MREVQTLTERGIVPWELGDGEYSDEGRTGRERFSSDTPKGNLGGQEARTNDEDEVKRHDII